MGEHDDSQDDEVAQSHQRLKPQAIGLGRFPPAKKCIVRSPGLWHTARYFSWATWGSTIIGFTSSWLHNADYLITQAICEEDHEWPTDHVRLRQGEVKLKEILLISAFHGPLAEKLYLSFFGWLVVRPAMVTPYLIFVTDATDGVRVNFFWLV